MPTLSLAPMLTVMPVREKRPTRTKCECGRKWEVIRGTDVEGRPMTGGVIGMKGQGCSTCKVWRPSFPKTLKRKSRGKQKITHYDLDHAIWYGGKSAVYPMPGDPLYQVRQFLMYSYRRLINGVPEPKELGGFYRFRLRLKYRPHGHWNARYSTVPRKKDGEFHYTASTNPKGRYPWIGTFKMRGGKQQDVAVFDAQEMAVFAGSWCLWFQLCQVGAAKVRGDQKDAYEFAAERLFKFRGWMRGVRDDGIPF